MTSAAHGDGRQLRQVIDTSNTAGDVWADSAYRRSQNETWFKANTLTSRIHRRKPKDKPLPENMARQRNKVINQGKSRARLRALNDNRPEAGRVNVSG